MSQSSASIASEEERKDDVPEADVSADTCLCNDLMNRTVPVPTLGRLQEIAATTTCDLCLLLHELADAFQAEEDSLIYLDLPNDGYRTTLEVSFLADMDEDDITLRVFVPPGVESPHPSIRTGTPVSYYSGSAECLELARRWLGECAQNHKDCKVPSDTLMPTRVIDIGGDGRDPVLVETEGRPGQYATLSYCWGKKPQLRTTKETLSAFLEAIPVGELQKTALDALEICRHLGIPYLWIDALCIVQDDEDDWLRESARMCDIYSSSALTIAAARSLSARQGVFGYQQYGSREYSQISLFRGTEVYARKVPVGEHVGKPLAVNIASQETGRVAEASWILRPQELPLARRAWTVPGPGIYTCRELSRFGACTLDGHDSHMSAGFMWLCFRHRIHLLYLPAHTSLNLDRP